MFPQLNWRSGFESIPGDENEACSNSPYRTLTLLLFLWCWNLITKARHSTLHLSDCSAAKVKPGQGVIFNYLKCKLWVSMNGAMTTHKHPFYPPGAPTNTPSHPSSAGRKVLAKKSRIFLQENSPYPRPFDGCCWHAIPDPFSGLDWCN